MMTLCKDGHAAPFLDDILKTVPPKNTGRNSEFQILGIHFNMFLHVTSLAFVYRYYGLHLGLFFDQHKFYSIRKKMS